MSSSNEEVLYETRTHFKVLFIPLVIQVFLLGAHYMLWRFLPTDTGWSDFNQWAPIILHVIIFIAEIWYVIVPVLQWWTSTFTLTSHRVYKNWGILYKQSREINLDHVVSVNSERGIIDRIFGAGTLVFLNASSSQTNSPGFWNKTPKHEGVHFTDVPNVRQVMSLVEKARFGSSK